MTDRKEKIRKLKMASEGVVSTVVDMVLVSLYFGFEFGFAGYGRGAQAGEKAQNSLDEFNYKTIKSSISYLKRKGLVQSVREGMCIIAAQRLGYTV